MKILTIVGARPQFIKAATVSRAIAEHNRRTTGHRSLITELIVHTGQHYDDGMSAVFFRELGIPEPDYNLGINSASHGAMTGGMQKEAYFFGVPCVTMRTETERVETVEAGWNVVVGADREKIVEAVRSFKSDNPHPKMYGDGRAAKKIIQCLKANQLNRLST